VITILGSRTISAVCDD